MNSIKTTLEMWGNWARCGVGTDYAKVNVTFQASLPAESSALFRTDDSQEWWWILPSLVYVILIALPIS